MFFFFFCLMFDHQKSTPFIGEHRFWKKNIDENKNQIIKVEIKEWQRTVQNEYKKKILVEYKNITETCAPPEF